MQRNKLQERIDARKRKLETTLTELKADLRAEAAKIELAKRGEDPEDAPRTVAERLAQWTDT